MAEVEGTSGERRAKVWANVLREGLGEGPGEGLGKCLFNSPDKCR
jgi:hypothetical protein